MQTKMTPLDHTVKWTFRALELFCAAAYFGLIAYLWGWNP